METTRGRGRIKLDDEERRDTTVQFRVNKAESEYLKELVEASGLERGHFIRKQILKTKPIIKVKLPEVNQKTYIQLTAIGNNINQAAKHLNEHKDFNKEQVDDFNFKVKQVIKRMFEIQKDIEL